ncbi:S-adenosyl-L-methionine-dependent methyltransferase [Rhizophagus diaphanus]|nr:S-adenosyl-L-methionine-dependent methyltransferase [Rhizophagus diaphanus] [Rhizophagus sp. MUCL 43196]
MGNIKSHIKHKQPSLKKIPEFDQIESDQERNEKLIDFYLSTSIDAIDRSHIYHFLRACIFQSSFSSPVEDELIKGCKVLDIGCGAATWLLDLSNKYENSYFYGVDIKPVYPQEIKPYNLEFIQADVTNRLSFNDDEFDFTHVEFMSFVFTPNQWDFVLSELIRVTKPGGYIEVAGRRNGYVGEGPIFRKLTDAIWLMYSKQGIDVKLMYNLDSKFELQQNIGKVHRIEKDFITGPNGGKIGLIWQDMSIAYFKSEMAIQVISKELGISEEEFNNMVENLTEEFKQTSAECVHVRFWAQKQLSE